MQKVLEKESSVVFSIFRELCNLYHQLILEHFNTTEAKYVSVAGGGVEQLQDNLFSASRDLSILDISKKWKYTTYDFEYGLFDLACFQGLSILQHILVFNIFLSSSISDCMDIPCFTWPFIRRGIPGLFPLVDYRATECLYPHFSRPDKPQSLPNGTSLQS